MDRSSKFLIVIVMAATYIKVIRIESSSSEQTMHNTTPIFNHEINTLKS
jgi:hypothetical protein